MSCGRRFLRASLGSCKLPNLAKRVVSLYGEVSHGVGKFGHGTEKRDAGVPLLFYLKLSRQLLKRRQLFLGQFYANAVQFDLSVCSLAEREKSRGGK